ncbi:MAG TPA: hypothetical protein PKD85_04995 [Saprospiraceae bacterium]|nr:hypothetical protein [Saprospiraceae bacterium]
MNKFNITKRDVLSTFLGFLTLFFLDLAFNYKSAKQAFMEGYNSVKCCEDKK